MNIEGEMGLGIAEERDSFSLNEREGYWSDRLRGPREWLLTKRELPDEMRVLE